jgi:predicted protein tyrosine phosphatase
LFVAEISGEAELLKRFSKAIQITMLNRPAPKNVARIKVTEKLILWSDLIFVMEKKHRERLSEKFQHALHNKKIIILDIEDNYQYMDPDLIDTLKTSVIPYL